MKNHNIKIGFIGQGFVGKNHADDYERRGYDIVRYALEEPFVHNKAKIGECDIVFIAVPTPTNPEGFDASIVAGAIALVKKGKTAVIKSTVLPGTTERLQKQFPDRFVLHAPEFLSESTAARDAAFPTRNIVGIPISSPKYRAKAKEVLSTLPHAPYSIICSAREAELIKYARNCAGFTRVIFTNILYDLAQSQGAAWSVIQGAMSADPDNGPTYTNPLHKSGRGAGGHCFIKDFAAFREIYQSAVGDPLGAAVISALEEKNIDLLLSTQKDLDLLEGVYGARVTRKAAQKKKPVRSPLSKRKAPRAR